MATTTVDRVEKRSKRDGWIIPAGEKWSYFIGAGSNFAVHQYVSSFLAAYLLMIGVSPATSATMLLVLKAWDAINDVLFGYFIDKVRFRPQSRKVWGWLLRGRYLPWFRIAAFILPVANIIMFTVNTTAPIWARVLQYAVGYVLYDLAFTLASAPYGCMLTSLTANVNERTFIQSYSILAQGLGSLPVIFIGTALIAGSFGYSGSAILFAIYGFLLALPAMFVVRERNIGEPAQAAEAQYNIREMFSFLGRVKELLYFELGQLVWGMFLTSGFLLFVAYYVFGDANITLIYTAFGVIPTMALIPFFPMIFKRVNKLTAIRIACLLYATSCFSIYLMGPEGSKSALGLHFLLYGICGFSYAFTMIGSAMVLPDIAEIAKYRTNTDRVGIIFSIHSFVGKLVGSLVTSVSLLILGAYGYVSVNAGSFEELAELNAQGIGLQTTRALQGLWNVSFLFPAIGFGLAAIFYLFVKIDSRQIPIVVQANQGEITHEEAEALLAAS